MGMTAGCIWRCYSNVLYIADLKRRKKVGFLLTNDD